MQNIKTSSAKVARFVILFMTAAGFVAGLLPAYVAAKAVNLSLKPLDLTRSLSTEEIMAAGQLGGALYPTRPLSDGDQQAEINLSFGRAIQSWNDHDYEYAARLFSEYIRIYPESPWVSEAVLHMGCYAQYLRRYTEAEDAFNWILDNNKGSHDAGAIALVNKARLRLGVLRVAQDRFEEASEIFRELKQKGHDWRHRTYASHWMQRLSRYNADRLSLLNCGTKALAYILEKRGNEAAVKKLRDLKPQNLHGYSIETLSQLASRFGYELVALRLSVTAISGLSLPAILYVAKGEKQERGHYLVLEKTEKDYIEIIDPQSGVHFRQSPDQLAKQWSGIALVIKDGRSLPGTKLTSLEMEAIFGGCCGQPNPPDGIGDPGPNAGPQEPGNSGCTDSASGASTPDGYGSPSWSVNMINMNVHVVDTPLWYKSSNGPSVNITVSYNSQSSITQHEPFGNKWQFNYASYLTIDPSKKVTIFMPDGRIDVYVPNSSGGYNRPYQVFNTLTRIADNYFELRYPDDRVFTYRIPDGTGIQQPFLVEIRDAHGQKLTINYNSNGQLASITDSMGRITSLSYNTLGLVSQVNDPFGRSASFEYDNEKNLIQITDMGGYWAKLSYDSDVYLTGLENGRGKWKFYIEPADGIPAYSDGYAPPGGPMWESYRVTVTNPLGGAAEYFYWGGGYDGSWYVSPVHYVRYVNQDVNNLTSAPKTEYHLQTVGENGEISYIVRPGGGTTTYGYNEKGNRISIKDAHGHVTQYTYNPAGRITSKTDAAGVITRFIYATNGVDLLEEKNGLGSIVRTYNGAHQVTSVQDRVKNPPWTFTYNNYGQIETATDPQGILTNYEYNAQHKLVQIKRDGMVFSSFTYDAVDRLASRTDTTGLTMRYEYDNLDHVIKLIYPDGKYVTYTYAGCCPHLVEQITDRAGRKIKFSHDSLQRLTEINGPGGKIANFLYDKNGNLIMFVDQNGNCTSFDYDATNLLVKKTYADGKSTYFEYDSTGLLTGRIGGRGIETAYTYDQNHDLLSVTYSDETPSVTNVYDKYGRRIQRSDATGISLYDYDSNSRLTSVDGPLTNDSITYQHDELGRRKSVAVQGGQSLSYLYDRLGRLSEIQDGQKSYKYAYAGVNPLVQQLTRPNGSKTIYQYDLLNRLTLISSRNSLDQIIREYGYTYNERDLRVGETRVDEDPIISLPDDFTLYDYNSLNQLTRSGDPKQVFLYDDDGNMTQGYTPDGYTFNATYDAENRLASIKYTDKASENVLRLNNYVYTGDGLIAEEKHFENGSLVKDIRNIRDEFLSVQERDQNNTISREYAWGLHMGGGIGGLISMRDGSVDYDYLYDGRGDVAALIDSTQAVVAAYSYDGYGNLLSKKGSVEQPFMFSTKTYNEKTGLSYYGYRFYAPSLGRWTTRDPLLEAGSLQLYEFAFNDPIRFNDPLGLFCLSDIWSYLAGYIEQVKGPLLNLLGNKFLRIGGVGTVIQGVNAPMSGFELGRRMGEAIEDADSGFKHALESGDPSAWEKDVLGGINNAMIEMFKKFIPIVGYPAEKKYKYNK